MSTWLGTSMGSEEAALVRPFSWSRLLRFSVMLCLLRRTKSDGVAMREFVGDGIGVKEREADSLSDRCGRKIMTSRL